MIPTLDYLKQYAIEQKQIGNQLSFKLKCLCGCETFTILERNYTNDEKRLIKEYENKIPYTGLHSIYGGLDSNGKPYSYIKILGIFKKYITFPQTPAFMDVNVMKSTCSQCQKEIILFDSRYYGYEGMMSNDIEAKKYIPHFKQSGHNLYGIEVTVENEPSLEIFNNVSNKQCSLEFYSNSFSWIRIHGLDENGKKKLLYDFETA
jgi:hypothetical protein